MKQSFQTQSMQSLTDSSVFDAGNAAYLEECYETYLKDPNAVQASVRHFFEQSLLVNDVGSEPIHSAIQQEFKQLARAPRMITEGQKPELADIAKTTLMKERKQTNVRALIDAYRLLGHLHAEIDPLKFREKPLVPELMLSYYHLSEKDLSESFDAGSLPGDKYRSLKQIIQDLKTIYCGSIASEFMHIPDSPERVWVQERVELMLKTGALELDRKRRLLERLTAVEGLEKYLGAKYPGAKRFSLEGNDCVVTILDEIIQKGGSEGIKEIVIGMAHRGRLNVLVNILGKSPSMLFDEFEGKVYDTRLESGDVKYHQGFSSETITKGGPLHLSLEFNPSHLEIVSPVVCGSVRARQDKRSDQDRDEVIAVLLHGDASFSGQGIVMETLNMSKTRAYSTGGSVHIIVNNQIGFTTSNPRDARSTLYCSDIGKMLEIPIFHVNANDPEAVLRITEVAMDYRRKFKKDVIIDLIGYRRYGHNEADEPSATQPMMYKVIRKLPTVWQLYAEKLIQENVYNQEQIEKLSADYRDLLDKRPSANNSSINNNMPTEYASNWQKFTTKDWRIPTVTRVNKEILIALAKQLEILPEDFELHPRVKKILDERYKMTRGELPLDWGYGEIIAYATLLNEGYPVRMSGQDCSRGTFFHRHATLHNQKDGSTYTPLCHISEEQKPFTIYDSLLSEAGVLGFEYGYATSDPSKLVIWEAQFGDFANEAQVLIDQFISSGEQKWGRLCGLTLYLPHGYEGQGPEHSSARLERYLQLCAEHNIQVCVPSTPAQMFHLLRRQMLRPMRKPLVVLTPKSLLRHKLAVSSLEDLAEGSFKPVVPEAFALDEKIKRVILCSGKVYYDVLERRSEQNINQIALLRIEQLYPFPEVELREALSKYSEVEDIVWCQEEPQNQGAWFSSQHNMIACLSSKQRLRYVGRKPSASPAVGYHHLHEMQQEALFKDALE